MHLLKSLKSLHLSDAVDRKLSSKEVAVVVDDINDAAVVGAVGVAMEMLQALLHWKFCPLLWPSVWW